MSEITRNITRSEAAAAPGALINNFLEKAEEYARVWSAYIPPPSEYIPEIRAKILYISQPCSKDLLQKLAADNYTKKLPGSDIERVYIDASKFKNLADGLNTALEAHRAFSSFGNMLNPVVIYFSPTQTRESIRLTHEASLNLINVTNRSIDDFINDRGEGAKFTQMELNHRRANGNDTIKL